MIEMAPAPSRSPGTDAIRDQIERLVRSPRLIQSAQLCRFLRHIVERELAGDVGSLKESVLGTEVFDRGDRFDPRTDSVVRVEARRLRSKLEEYYSSEGAQDPVIVRLPRGGYVPVFEHPVLPVQPSPEGIPRPRAFPRRLTAGVALVLALCAAGGLLWFRRQVRAPAKISIAVMPFANAGGDPETEYFADGFTDQLIDELGRTDGLRVIARNSVFAYKGQTGDVRQIARKLDADTILDGSVRRQGQHLRISAQLIDARTGYETWSETIERDWSQVLTVQQDLAASIASKLHVRRTAPRPTRYTANLESYDLYLRGRFHWNKRNGPGLEAAVSEFRQAINKDPNYALAWAGLADAWSMLGFIDSRSLGEIRPKAGDAATRALQLDPSLAEAHVALANVRALYDWDWAGAEQSYRRALELDPGSSLAHYGLSKLLASEGRLDAGIAEARRAHELDPLSLIITELPRVGVGGAAKLQGSGRDLSRGCRA